MSSQPGNILLVAMDQGERNSLAVALEEHGHRVTATASFPEARDQLEKHPPGVVITDVRLGDFNGLHLALLSTHFMTTRAIVLDDYLDPVLESQAQEFGALYLVKPVDPLELTIQVSSIATETRRSPRVPR